MDEPPRQPATPPWVPVDASREARPGVPLQRRPVPDAGAHGEPPEQQRRGMPPPGGGVVLRATPVYGTAQPLHGVSGAVRRVAYRIPEHRAGRWVLLLAADRLEVLGRRARGAGWLVAAAAGLALGYVAVSRALARR